MSQTPQTGTPGAAPGDPANITSTDCTQEAGEKSPPIQQSPTADQVLSRLAAIQLDTYAQTVRALHAPKVVTPPAGDHVSALTAARFGAHAQMLEAISTRFAEAHEALLKSLAEIANSGTADGPGDTGPTT
ncbi:PE family protein [Mycobacterium helveticum]|nr:PE family protein [Mycobacterium helveticum]TVS87002.1 PE family protein [Mycobacterium helveticum]